MKYLFVTFLLSISYFTNAQTVDTSEFCMPTEIARQIQTDLLIGDSAKAMLDVTIQELDLTNQKLSYKDSLLLTAKLNEYNLVNQIKKEQELKQNYMSTYSKLEKDYKSLSREYKLQKVKGKLTGIVGITTIAVLSFLVITK